MMIKHKHQQLFDLLMEELRRGTWLRGKKLPNLKELAVTYNVSINVASKAVELLKERKMVSVKVGDGIYSLTSGQESILEFRYAGRRLFGKYSRAKMLRVLVQDNTPWQLEFWNPFFNRITHDFPDIELKIAYAIADKPAQIERFDLGFGATEFLVRTGFPTEFCQPRTTLNAFYPHLYDNMLLPPLPAPTPGDESFFPYAYLNYYLLSHLHHPAPVAGEDALTYIERLAADSRVPVGYNVLNCGNFLANSGLLFFDPFRRQAVIPDRDLLLRQFIRARRLFQAGHLVWMHGAFADYEEICQLHDNQPIHIVEYLHNRTSLQNRKQMQEKGITLLPYPTGENPLLIPLTAAVHRACPFPEECFRVLRKLLEPDMQQLLAKNLIGQPIHPTVAKATEGNLMQACRENRVKLYYLTEKKLEDIINYFVSWEFWYFLNGKRGNDVADFIDRKITFYLQLQQNNPDTNCPG